MATRFLNQKPIVYTGQEVNKGSVLADGSATDLGEIALGKNILVAFMPWNGYNFEDSILLSEKLVKKDVYTSIHINEYETVIRDTRLGPEETTKNLPNINKNKTKNLDDIGIINVGTKVNSEDILVGKITPKNDTPLSPEEKLLRAIFGEKSNNVKNSSLKVPTGEKGVIIKIKMFIKRGIKRDQRSIIIENNEIYSFLIEKKREIEITKKYIMGQIDEKLRTKIKKSRIIINKKKIEDIKKIKNLIKFFIRYKKNIDKIYSKKIEALKNGDDLPQGILKIIKIYIANKVKIQSGDKMSGRHGNKGVVSKIINEEEMPYIDNGETIDMILNPLGVPSRMNIGQILETHLGWISYLIGKKIYKNIKVYKFDNKENTIKYLKNELKKILIKEHYKKIIKYIKRLDVNEIIKLIKEFKKGIKFTTQIFDGINEINMNKMLRKINYKESAQIRLRDGRNGEYFKKEITIGYNYMLKLDHLVDNKIHSRSIGPYSLVTQQPLGGKSHFGGQRFGEMECWALQAYGAAYTLREMITIKSDDVIGRIKAYETIIKNDNSFEIGLPESFKVMIKEIRSLGLNIEIINNKNLKR